MAPPSRALDETWVASTYGVLMPAKSVAQLLGFPTPAALRRAHATGRLAVRLFRLDGRRGWFAHAGDVSAYLQAQGATRTGDSAMT